MKDNKKGISDEYFDYYTKYTNEYGEKTCIFMQIGSFYEMNMVKNDKECIGNLTEIVALLNIQMTKKNKNIDRVDRGNPYMAGFPKPAITKYMPILLDKGYTVIIIDQVENNNNSPSKCKLKREVVGIYSPSIQHPDNQFSKDENSLTSILIDVISYKSNHLAVSYSISNIDISTNEFQVYENYIDEKGIVSQYVDQFLDDIYRILLRHQSGEILIYIIGENVLPSQLNKEYLKNYLELYNVSIQWLHISKTDVELKNFSDINFQNAFFRKVFNTIEFGMLDPVDYLDLSRNQLSILNIIYTLSFIAKHDEKYIQNINLPKLTNDYNYLLLEMNTMYQLNIISNKKDDCKNISLFDIINKTNTNIGKRGLKNLLCKPYKNSEDIEYRYKLSESIEPLVKESKKNKSNELLKLLDEMCDFEKLHRKMSLQILHPHELFSLYITYNNLYKLYKLLKSQNNETLDKFCLLFNINDLENLIEYIETTFDLDRVKKYTINESSLTIENFFKNKFSFGKLTETEQFSGINEIEESVKQIEKDVEDLRLNYEKLINQKQEGTKKSRDKDSQDWIKTTYSDQDGYYFICTKIRGNILQKVLHEKKLDSDLTIKLNTNLCKITNKELSRASEKLIKYRNLLCKRIKEGYINILKDLYTKNIALFVKLKEFVETIDICYSNIKCKYLYNYCRPVVEKQEISFIHALQLRHPIIERINQKIKYIPNDIFLDEENEGMILYALNSCGKSSLLRSIGISIIMAQCGLYVPCKEFKFSPFNTIISQVDMSDNIWKGQSSFITEMIGLRKIMKISDEKCLVLSDELTKGTEVVSATSIFAASVLELVKRQAKFVFSTHLQDVAKLQKIQECQTINICHLSVDIQGDEILFERKIKPGPCSELYGLEVAKAVGIDPELIESSFKIRDTLINRKQELLKTKKSRYNKQKILDKCEICNYSPCKKTDIPLDTHHIDFQCTADSNNFINHYHKNSEFNLVVLCKECHTKVHKNLIIIDGYNQKLSGVKLNYHTN